ncbi:HXXEE domain-containing protein [Paenibacillus sp. GCM10012307]|uniref:HXXEE domain-containing protein n=1 Tax=Paenibacillus roseus TaxID=2798579 RepID=A0A934J706_9BACL|nr:HXXEE domain-containing protein [Paenibacillus roseus]MBJ6364080.1 HXXEE domain-containing protein [Paenibacillus roseus]
MTFNFVFWLPYVVLLIHTIEEIPGFSKWATRHFAPMTAQRHVMLQVGIILVVLLVSYQASTQGNHRLWIILAAAFQLHLGINAVFHVVTTIIYKEYSPGLLTAVTLSIPATLYFFHEICTSGKISSTELVLSLLAGTIIGTSAIAALFLKQTAGRG